MKSSFNTLQREESHNTNTLRDIRKYYVQRYQKYYVLSESTRRIQEHAKELALSEYPSRKDCDREAVAISVFSSPTVPTLQALSTGTPI